MKMKYQALHHLTDEAIDVRTFVFTAEHVREAIERWGIRKCEFKPVKLEFGTSDPVEAMKGHLEPLLMRLDCPESKALADRDHWFAWFLYKGFVSSLVGWDALVRFEDPQAAYNELATHTLKKLGL